jgi:hypothetical protein
MSTPPREDGDSQFEKPCLQVLNILIMYSMMLNRILASNEVLNYILM